jgi:hypothetical protein
MRKKPTRIVAQAEYDLPPSFVRQIGIIMVRWAYFEHAVRRLVWEAMGVDPKMGRIAVRDPRIDDRIEMIGDIAYLRKLKIDEKALTTLETGANEVLRWRDLLAHGIWIPQPHGWLIQMTSGNYPKDYLTEHRKRRINPEGVNVSIEGLRTVADGAKTLIENAIALREQIQAQAPLS